MGSFTTITVIYDGDCGLCQRSLNALRRFDIFKTFEYLPFQQTENVATRFPQLKNADFENAMVAVDSDGKPYRGFFAFRKMILKSPLLWPLIIAFYFPGSSRLGPKIYAWVARNRHQMTCKLPSKK